MFRSSIDKKEINLLPLGHFKGIVTLVERKQDVASIISGLAEEPVLGFDTETKPSFKKGKGNKVSLLQLSSARKAWLFRLNHTGFPESLVKLLENPAIVKVGVAIHDDLKALNNLREFSPGGFIELQSFVKKFNILDNGLRRLAGNILNVKISKSQQLSNWEAPELSKAQISYAATDAWACYEIYMKLLEYEHAQH